MTIDIEDWAAGVSVKRHPNDPECLVELLCPPRNGDDSDKVRAVTIGMCDVRASDEIQVSFDFNRNGWVIKQHRYAGAETDRDLWSYDDYVWDEVGFHEVFALTPLEDG